MGWMLWLVVLAAGGLAQNDAPFRDTAVIPSFRKADPQLRLFETVGRTRVDDSLDLLLVRGSPKQSGYGAAPGQFGWDKEEWLGLFLQERERPARAYQLSVLPNGQFFRGVKVLRATSTELLLALHDGLDRHDVTLQFFVDPRAKVLVKRIDYRPFSFLRILPQGGVPLFIAGDDKQFLVVRPSEADGRFEILSPGDAKPVLTGLPVESWGTGSLAFFRVQPQRFSPVRFGPEGRFTLEQDKTKRWGHEWSTVKEQAGGKSRSYDLPPSTWEDFAKARPGRVRAGHRREGTEFAEEIGPVQFRDGRLWFGKTFYDAEGMTGVGALGYFDVAERKFALFSPPEISDWSVSALLVEADAVWVGLMHRGEYGDTPGGLLKWSTTSRQAQLIPLEAGINAIARHGDRLLLATEEGISVLIGETFEDYLIAQTIQGRYRVVRR